MSDLKVAFKDNETLAVEMQGFETVDRMNKEGEFTGVTAFKTGFLLKDSELAAAIQEGTAVRTVRPDGSVAYVSKASVIVETKTADEMQKVAAAKAGRALVADVKKRLGLTEAGKQLAPKERIQVADLQRFLNAYEGREDEATPVVKLCGRSSHKLDAETAVKLMEVLHRVSGKTTGTTGKKLSPDAWYAKQLETLFDQMQKGVIDFTAYQDGVKAAKNGYHKLLIEAEQKKADAAAKRVAAKKEEFDKAIEVIENA